MTTDWQRITVEEVEADPTNAYEMTVHGEVAIASLEIHDKGNRPWVAVRYANGGSSAGCPAHWASYWRKIEDAETDDDGRKLGVMVQPVGPAEDEMALGTAPDGTVYLICTEGVSWKATEEEAKLTPVGEPVDLARFVRKFGARLESNFWQQYARLTQTGE